MKICLFGGTFDPPHIGHLLIAQTIFEEEVFDKILFVPAYKPPHKNSITPVDRRVDMLRLAIKDNPNFDMSDAEINRRGISYSIDTIQSIKKNLNLDKKDCYFLIGSDTLLKFHTWRNPRKILNECQVIVAIRPGFRPSDLEPWILHKVHFASIPRFEISSKTIRTRWAENKTIRYMVSLPVWNYINKKKLYLIKKQNQNTIL